MSEKHAENIANEKSSHHEPTSTMKKKTTDELEQEAYMAQQYATVIGELKAAEARNR
jgi:hypothetical protein